MYLNEFVDYLATGMLIWIEAQMALLQLEVFAFARNPASQNFIILSIPFAN